MGDRPDTLQEETGCGMNPPIGNGLASARNGKAHALTTEHPAECVGLSNPVDEPILAGRLDGKRWQDIQLVPMGKKAHSL